MSELPRFSIPPPKIDIDNKARFCYLDCHRFRLIDASICWAAVDARTQFAIYDSSAPEKQLPIFKKMSFLKMENIHKFYGSVHALKGVDFEVGSNEIVALIGDNGAGKSTLVEIIAGSLSKSRGKIFVKGKEVDIPSVKAARDLGIEMVYQDQAVVETLSVAKNIFLGRELLRPGLIKLLDMGKMEKEAEGITKSLGLDIASPDQEVRFCSGGERQGVAISRAMYFKAELVILDEPTAALSIVGVQKVLEFIRQLKDSGASCIFISHNLYHVYPVADRIVVFSKGEKVADMRKDETSIEELEQIQISGKRVSS